MHSDLASCHRLASLLQELGYKAKFDAEEGFLETGMAGLRVLAYYFDQGTMQLFCGLRLSEEAGFGLHQVNDFNKKYRFSKLYMMDDESLAMEQDFLLDLSSDTALADLQRITGLWEGSLSFWKEELADARRAAAAAAA
jgi:hypothetical protein